MPLIFPCGVIDSLLHLGSPLVGIAHLRGQGSLSAGILTVHVEDFYLKGDHVGKFHRQGQG